jgi:hypothetical protein
MGVAGDARWIWAIITLLEADAPPRSVRDFPRTPFG